MLSGGKKNAYSISTQAAAGFLNAFLEPTCYSCLRVSLKMLSCKAGGAASGIGARLVSQEKTSAFTLFPAFSHYLVL